MTTPLDRDRFSAIAHATHEICNPISAAKVDRIIGLLELAPGSRALDIGAGKAQILARACNRFELAGVAIERSPLMAAACRDTASRLWRGSVEVLESAAAPACQTFAPASFSLILCIGSSHALGSLDQTLATAHTLLAPGGWLILGEGYWKKEPSPDFLAALDSTRDELSTHAENIERLEASGFVPRWACTASDDEWDEYEWRYSFNIEAHVEKNPTDPEAQAMLKRSRDWRALAQRWGRDTLGFGLYLARKA